MKILRAAVAARSGGGGASAEAFINYLYLNEPAATRLWVCQRACLCGGFN